MTNQSTAGPLTRRPQRRLPTAVAAAAVAATVIATMSATSAQADPEPGVGSNYFHPGNLLISRSVYDAPASTVVAGKTQLPPGCTTGCATAGSDGTYPEVFNNDLVDSSFGVTAPIYLDQLNPSGRVINSLAVPTDQLVTSFSSKSELALNLSTSGQYVTFMGYPAPDDALDVSNSNTPGVFDATNPVPSSYYRAVGQVGADGRFQFTETNAYSGNNGRAAILNDSDGQDVYYTAGNAGNGGKKQPVGVIAGTGTQLITPSLLPENQQQPGDPTPVGSFNVTQLGDTADKIGKDTNFRGLTIYNNVVYLTKGSGGNGINTVYFIDTTGKACPNGVGLPVPGAQLPTTPLSYDPTTIQANGLPNNMCILNGFPTALKSTTSFPFGLWFANPTTMYVADEGNGDAAYDPTTSTYSSAAAQTTAGLQKWSLINGSWTLDYTLADGLNLGSPYSVAGYPTGNNPATGLPWAPATDGLRNITGRVNGDGTVNVYAVTSTVSGSGDQGADPNKVVEITDKLGGISSPTGNERFTTLDAAPAGQALRGVSFTPGS
jgi:hypothetical protein